MIRVRENNSEFGNCSTVKKNFWFALFPFLKYYKESTLHGRTMQLFQRIKACDTTSERGKREVGKGILTLAGKELFSQFMFTPKCDVAVVVPMNASYDTVSCVYSVMDFNNSLVRYPKHTTHMELQFGVLGIDFDLAVYKMSLANPLIFEKGVAITNFTIVPNALPDVGLNRFAFLGVTFYQEINGVKYVLKEEGNVGVAFVG